MGFETYFLDYLKELKARYRDACNHRAIRVSLSPPPSVLSKKTESVKSKLSNFTTNQRLPRLSRDWVEMTNKENELLKSLDQLNRSAVNHLLNSSNRYMYSLVSTPIHISRLCRATYQQSSLLGPLTELWMEFDCQQISLRWSKG